MSLITTMRRQYAIWWERLSPNEYGEFAYAAPVEVRCRWEDIVTVTMTAKGDTALSRATVYVDREMKIGDFLKKGRLTTGTESDPKEDDAASEIMIFENLPNMRNTENLLTARL